MTYETLPKLDGANNEIVAICNTRIKELYGENVPDNARERLDTELKTILENEYAILYMIPQKLFKVLNLMGYLAIIRGSVGSSLVAYLLGITEFNPLDYNLQFEVFAGLDGYRLPLFDIGVSEEGQKMVNIILQNALTIIEKLEKLTGAPAKTIPLDDKETLDIFKNADTTCILGFDNDFVRNILKTTKPKTFDDLVNIYGVTNGSYTWAEWDAAGHKVVITEMPEHSEIIAFRDDVMLYLIEKGIDRETAYKIMESVRKGKGVTDEQESIMTTAGVPDWYIKSCKQTQYLFPKAHAISYTMLAVRLAWYKCHYSNEFHIAQCGDGNGG